MIRNTVEQLVLAKGWIPKDWEKRPPHDAKVSGWWKIRVLYIAHSTTQKNETPNELSQPLFSGSQNRPIYTAWGGRPHEWKVKKLLLHLNSRYDSNATHPIFCFAVKPTLKWETWTDLCIRLMTFILDSSISSQKRKISIRGDYERISALFCMKSLSLCYVVMRGTLAVRL